MRQSPADLIDRFRAVTKARADIAAELKHRFGFGDDMLQAITATPQVTRRTKAYQKFAEAVLKLPKGKTRGM
jgi:hypothetical protein